ncbi:hypothetical protein [Pelagimonas varians]|uniref:Uncharacterized protein n=1 Tax=Pelagimonas varians TaxID=696760 RepID=A0A238K7J5_9RHOB|nr:hypothetical protein [Pelagimonas varians]PYG30336.1 hypothetical protein C8N36_10643 [Pelagimonas varians]SMX37926.1 hypothetical protein PEV8663_01247 [Pelagimonas varians]
MSIDLTADCSRCAALCCMALAFDKGADFALDKPAGVGCVNLRGDFGCQIHDSRIDAGFSGCLKFDCLGAGQRITQEVFAGVDWRDTPAAIPDIIEAFRILREVHRLHELLGFAADLPLAPAQRDLLHALMEELAPNGGWTADSLNQLPLGRLSSDATSFLGSLKTLAKRGGISGKA